MKVVSCSHGFLQNAEHQRAAVLPNAVCAASDICARNVISNGLKLKVMKRKV